MRYDWLRPRHMLHFWSLGPETLPERTAAADILSMFSDKLLEKNSTLTFERDLGKLTLRGNILMAQALRQWALCCLHTSPVLATLLVKALLLPLDLLRQHRMGYKPEVDCTNVASRLTKYTMHDGERGEDGKRVRGVSFYEGFVLQ
mmetsp:Transcript_29183/g.47898  ORF Transcript_29183/g.47898 Transcript_29183/m.47898 type:complete len:146 (+) Transcript_29183:25-462(+)